MIYPLTVRDFLDRAEQVYGERVGIIDEPDQPAPSLGSLTYREVARNARRQARKLDESACRSAGGWRSSRRTRRGC